MTAVLRLEKLTKRYAGLTAVEDVTLTIEKGARHAIIGPNGAGKSTLFGMIAGAVPVTSGRLELNGTDIAKTPEAKRVRLGVARTFQHSSLFLTGTVFENVALAAQRAHGVAAHVFANLRRYKTVTAEVNALLQEIDLLKVADQVVSTLSHGERRQLEVAIALATHPSVLLLDEPTAGMSVAERDRFATVIRDLPADVTVVLIEHDMDLIFQLASHVSVLQLGRLIADGDPNRVRGLPEVQAAYLGDGDLGELFHEKGTR